MTKDSMFADLDFVCRGISERGDSILKQWRRRTLDQHGALVN